MRGVSIEVGSIAQLATHSHPLKRDLSDFPATVLALVYQLLIAAPVASQVTLDGQQMFAAAFGIRALR